MILQTIIKRNNATVSFLQQQDFPNAVVSSTDAMTLLEELHRKSPAIVALAGTSTTTCEPDFLDQCMILISDASKTTDVPHSEEGGIDFIYDKGIVIPTSSINNEECEVFSTILIFNSALAHQLYAQQQQLRYKGTTAWQRYLLKSKRLYELALRAYSEDSEDQNVLFQFAIMNNIAVIELQTGNTALSKQ